MDALEARVREARDRRRTRPRSFRENCSPALRCGHDWASDPGADAAYRFHRRSSLNDSPSDPVSRYERRACAAGERGPIGCVGSILELARGKPTPQRTRSVARDPRASARRRGRVELDARVARSGEREARRCVELVERARVRVAPLGQRGERGGRGVRRRREHPRVRGREPAAVEAGRVAEDERCPPAP